MNIQRLCPVYRKWLQLNPSSAREHRLLSQHQAQKAHKQGDVHEARTLGYQAFETAKVVLTSLQPTTQQHSDTVTHDIAAFGSLGLYLYSLLRSDSKKREAHTILQECQQQLMAVMPLHASSPNVCRLICTIQYAIERMSVPFQSQHMVNIASH